MSKLNFIIKTTLAVIIPWMASSAMAQSVVETRDAEPAVLDVLHELIESTLEPGTPGGAVIVARGDEVLYLGAIGDATLGGRALRENDRFRIASVTKQMTASAVLQLVEQGQLQLSDRLVDLIPEYPKHANDITVEMLLNHTSGIRDFTQMESFSIERETEHLDTESLMAYFWNEPLMYQPGTERSYCNAGYVLLGVIIERVTKRSFADHIKSAVFEPAGMMSSTAKVGGAIEIDPVVGHSFENGEVIRATRTSLTWPFAAGCVRSTVGDLLAWDRAIFSGKIVSLELLASAHQPTTLPDGTVISYGFGWDLSRVQGAASFEHGGLISGFSSSVVSVPSEGVFVAVLINQAWGGVFDFSARLAAAAMGQPYEDAKVIKLPAGAMAAYEGLYAEQSGVERRIELRDGRLHSQRVDGQGAWLLPIGTERFVLEGSLTEVSFERDELGRVVRMIWHTRAGNRLSTLTSD